MSNKKKEIMYLFFAFLLGAVIVFVLDVTLPLKDLPVKEDKNIEEVKNIVDLDLNVSKEIDFDQDGDKDFSMKVLDINDTKVSIEIE